MGTLNDPAIAEIKQAEEQRSAFFNNGDFLSLADLLHDDFTYFHASGRREDKPTYLAGVSAHKNRVVERGDLVIRIYGDVALVTGLYMMNSPERSSKNDSLAVWVKTNNKWLLVAHQGTRMP